MFDIGWSELLVIGVVALIVVGPKDLPRMFRTLGEFTGKARRMAREFQHAMNEAADESGVGDITKDLRKMANPKKYGSDVLKDATRDLSSWSPDAADGKAKPGLSKDRAATKAKIEQATAAKAQARLDAEAAELSAEPDLQPDPEATPPAAEPASAVEPVPETKP
ncbi:Sec-independent protein translocase protein TatB [uncultured Jannaschia sp.]|uniref:Sec-independent protein translocase protein TatB n=1 Tax=uncultured Jannaschia sp. TaxID=293347 RepID=UPI0026198FB8|nr:Sec-independent protein translocase protein TatB [uncultured Jannaschia sp.]